MSMTKIGSQVLIGSVVATIGSLFTTVSLAAQGPAMTLQQAALDPDWKALAEIGITLSPQQVARIREINSRHAVEFHSLLLARRDLTTPAQKQEHSAKSRSVSAAVRAELETVLDNAQREKLHSFLTRNERPDGTTRR